MKKIIYVMTSSGNDFFSVMTRISLVSVRITNPDIRIAIACDQETSGMLKKCNDPILDEIDELKVFTTISGVPAFRNRFVKTRLRNLVDGPYLFLDSDTVVRGDISGIFSVECDIAGARNLSKSDINEQIWEEDRDSLELMDWKTRNDIYINGGVLLFNDTKKTRLLASVWHDKWLDSVYKTKRFRDQPSLNSAIYDITPNLYILSDKYNAQFKKNTKVIPHAFVWHYYSSIKNNSGTKFELLVKKVGNSRKLSNNDVKNIIQSEHPWQSSNAIDSFAANRIIRKGTFDGWEASWLKRDCPLLIKSRKLIKGLKKLNFRVKE